MTTQQWQLPGPSTFVDRILRDIRTGKNVIVRLPLYSGDSLYEYIRDVEGMEGLIWQKLDLRADDSLVCQPLDYIYERILYDTPAGEVRSIPALTATPSFAGRGFWIKVDDSLANIWSAWKLFLQHYNHACGNVSLLERSIFCFELCGVSSLDAPEDDIRLVSHAFSGIVNSLDAWIYCAKLLDDEPISTLEKSVATAVLANLSLWDFELARRLSTCPLSSLLQPKQILELVREERGWNGCIQVPCWHTGAKNNFDGKWLIHSAALEGSEGEIELKRRIWQAQVSVLLPLIEELRHTIIRDRRNLLTIPHVGDFGTIEKYEELEVGHLYHQLSQRHDVPPNVLELVHSLRKIRNLLAHLQLVETTEIAKLSSLTEIASEQELSRIPLD